MSVPSKSFTRLSLFIRFEIIILAMSVLATSCSAAQKQPPAVSPDPRLAVKTADRPQVNSVEQRILDQYQRWKGTRHRLGGTGSQGIDCSGFITAVYRDAFNINLPRTTQAQVHKGKSVSLNELKPGDLVFFKPPGYLRHVGIYLNRSKFVHASKSKGVTISKIDEYYWGKYFWTAKRIIPDSKN
jgi:cell wall-associated NlpC family hydrolase